MNFIQIICVSASKRVVQGVERRPNGFSYVQGSGDDHELWSIVVTFLIRDLLSHWQLIQQFPGLDTDNILEELQGTS